MSDDAKEPMVVGEATGLLIPAPEPRRRSLGDIAEAILRWTAHVLAVAAVLVLLGLWIGEGMGWLS